MKYNRSDLIKNLINDVDRHIIICAPSGYGKSMLLENIARQLSEPVIDCNKTKRLLKSNKSEVLLLDNGYKLDEKLITELLSQDVTKQRIFITLYHTKYSSIPMQVQKRLVRLVSSQDLKFTNQELSSIGLKNELIKSTDGWPFVCMNYCDGILSLSDYLDALIDQIGKERDFFLDNILKLRGLNGPIHMEDHLVKRILNKGFPMFRQNEFWYVTPLVVQYIFKKYDKSIKKNEKDEQLNILESIVGMNDLHIDQKIEIVECFFRKYNYDDSYRELKRELLISLGIDNLSPFLKDVLAYYYLSFGENNRAESILMLQMNNNSCTTQTYVHLARIAGKRNDFIAQSEYVKKSHSKAVTRYDLCSSELAFADYYARVNRFEEALKASESAYKHANKLDNVEMRLFSLKSIAYANQMLGNISTAIASGEEALSICRSFDKYDSHFASISYNLADISKDLGNYNAAFDYLNESLRKGESVCSTNLPYIYNCLGLVHLELGNNDCAINNLKLSLKLFEQHSNISGSILPATYLGFAYYRMNDINGVEFCFRKIQEIGNLIRDNESLSLEYYAFYPLVESVRFILKGYFDEALKSIERLLTKDTLTYDSVLLSILIKGYILDMKEGIPDSYIQELESVLDARNTVGDPTALAYALDFRHVYHTCFNKSGNQRFQKLANMKIKSESSCDVKYHIYLHTIGNVFLEINGKRVKTRSLAPLYTLAYFIYIKDWIKIEDLGTALFSGRTSSKKSASQALSGLRAILRSFGTDLESILSVKGDPRGFCLMESEIFNIKTDINYYMTDFDCENPDIDLLFRMLKNVSVFLPNNKGSFSDQVNHILQVKVSQVALYLYDFFYSKGNEEYAAESILYGLRFVDDDDLIQTAEKINDRLLIKNSINAELKRLR